MANRGKKDCPNCNTEIGARCLLCSHCGYHYPTKEIRQDLLDQYNKPKEIKTFTEPGQGRKQCPECKIFVGAVTKNCPKCKFDFSTIVKEVVEKKEKKEKKEENNTEIDKKHASVMRILAREESVSDPHFISKGNLTPKEHAQRILDYGEEKATMLYNLHRYGTTWSHVDWKLVEERLKI